MYRACVIGVLALGLPAVVAAQGCLDAGYPVTVTPIGDVRVDSAFLAATARAVAHRWATPSRRRNQMPQYRRVRTRTLPDIPRWADDWRPTATHRAAVVLVLRRRGRASISNPSPESGDRPFDRSLESIVEEPLPASPVLPDIPETVEADTLALELKFGVEPEGASYGIVRFAAQQEPVVLVQSTLVVDYRERRSVSVGQGTQSAIAVLEGIRALVKYDVTENGQVDARSVQVVETNDRDFGRAIQDALLRARYNPAMTNCVPVRITVVQQFGN